MKKKSTGFLAFFVFLYISPVILSSSYIAPAIGNESQFTISADGDYWLEGFAYREKLTINGSTGAGSNYPVRVVVYHDTDDGEDNATIPAVCTEGNAQANFSDIRFTDNDGNTTLDYWLENKIDSTNATFWFKMADDISSGQVSAYIYYSNYTSPVTTTSDGDDTFHHFLDFVNSPPWQDPWQKTGSTVAVSGGYTTLNSTASYGDGEDSASFPAGFAVMVALDVDVLAASSFIRIEARENSGSVYNDEANAVGIHIGDDPDTTVQYRYWNQSSAYTAGDALETPALTEGQYWVELGYYNGFGNLTLYNDMWLTEWNSTSGSVNFTGNLDTLAVITRDVAGTNASLDYIFVRKFVTSEPFIDEISAEETIYQWVEVSDLDIIFHVPLSSETLWAINAWYILLGMLLVPASGLYLVKGGRKEASLDKFYFAMIMFFVGWALIIGGVMP